VHLRIYPSVRVYFSSRMPHDYRPRAGPAHRDCPMGPVCKRMAALLLHLSWRNIAVAPTGLAPMAPSRRAAMLIPGKKWISITIPVAIIVSMVAQHAIAVTIMVAITIIPPLDSVIPVFVLVVATALAHSRTGSQSQAQQHYQSNP